MAAACSHSRELGCRFRAPCSTLLCSALNGGRDGVQRWCDVAWRGVAGAEMEQDWRRRARCGCESLKRYPEYLVDRYRHTSTYPTPPLYLPNILSSNIFQQPYLFLSFFQDQPQSRHLVSTIPSLPSFPSPPSLLFPSTRYPHYPSLSCLPVLVS